MAIEEELMQQAPEEMPQEAPPEEEDTSGSDELDLKIAVLLGERLLQEGGFDVIEKAIKHSSDPSQVIGQFILQMGQQLMESMPDDVKLSPRILLAQGGWVEQISDIIQSEAGVKSSVMDKAEIYVASTAQQMAQAKEGQVNGQQAPAVPQVGPAPPAMPQGAV